MRVLILLAILAGAYAGTKRVCYYSNWSQYRNGAAKFKPDDIDPFLCTHLMYSFAKLDDNHELAMYEWNDDVLYSQFNGMKTVNEDLKTLLAVGGWTAGSTGFSTMVHSDTLRMNFVLKSITFLRTWGFDGLDLDWEYPTQRTGSKPTDRQKFITLIDDLLSEFNKEAAATGKPRLLLTAAVAAGKTTIEPSYDIPAMGQKLDFINIMAYDLHGGWEDFLGHNAPLYNRTGETAEQGVLNVDWAAHHWHTQGVPKDKLIIGLATYGRGFTMANAANHEIGDAATSAAPPGLLTGEAGFLAYYELCKMLENGATRHWNAEQKVPYLTQGTSWYGYDDPESFIIKLQYIRDHGYGGAMVWNIDLDDFDQYCLTSTRRYPLMSLMEEVLGGHNPTVPTQNPPVTTKGDTEATTDAQTGPTNQPGTDSTAKQTTQDPGPTTGGTTPAPGDKKRVCYYSNWSQYRNGVGHFLPGNIDPFLCTHIVYAFAKIGSDFELAMYEWNDDVLYKAFNDLKLKNPALKTLLAVGGWTHGSPAFSDMVTDATKRRNFAKTSAEYLRTWDFDGLDLDWEYPTQRSGSRPSDRQNFIHLLDDLLAEYQADAQARSKPRLLITAAVAAGKATIDPSYDIPSMGQKLDFINLMAYDLHGSWEKVLGHQAPLYARSDEIGNNRYLNVDWASRYWVDEGCPKHKLIVGLATYGRGWVMANSANNEMGDSAYNGSPNGPYTNAAGFLAYYEICKMLENGATRHWHNEHKVPYLTQGDTWVGYDDKESIIVKLQYIRDMEYGGAMVWNLALDDFNQHCASSRRPFPLISLIADVLGGYDPPTQEPTEDPVTLITDGTTEKITTQKKPTTSEPISCEGYTDGYHPHPTDCSKYFQCWSGVYYPGQCGAGLVYNPYRSYCDYPYNVECGAPLTTKEPTTAGPTPEPTTAPPTDTPVTMDPSDPTTEGSPKTTESTTEGPTPPVTTKGPTPPPDASFCTDRRDGLYKKQDDCSSYYNCAHGNTHVYQCHEGSLYNAHMRDCDWADKVDCSLEDPTSEFCSDKADGIYTYPLDCSQFYTCANQQTHITACYPGTYWSPSLFNCDWIANVDCGDRPEPPSDE